MTSQNPEERCHHRRNRAQQSFRIVNASLSPDVRTQEHAIDKRRDTSFLAEIARRVSRRRERRHHEAVNDEQRDRDQKLCSDFVVRKISEAIR